MIEQAARCRRLAQAINDVEFAGKLEAMAERYEMSAAGSGPSLPLHKDIERCAYLLWQEAGEPEGRDLEFYLQAEQQLREACIAKN